MFITNKEKEWMVDAILKLQQQFKEFQEGSVKLDRRFDNLAKYVIKSKVRIEELERELELVTEEAPWGYKKDGTPCKRPGRAPKTKEQA